MRVSPNQPGRPRHETKRRLGAARNVSTAGGAPRCGRNKCEADAPLFSREHHAKRRVLFERSAKVVAVTAGTKTDEGNEWPVWAQCKPARTETVSRSPVFG